MSNTVEELVVAARPEGLEDVSDGFEAMQDDLEDVEGQMEDTTGQFEDLQNRWQGAMSAILGGVALAVGGLLSTVPILGSVMEGLGSIIAAVGFQIDQLARDLGAGGLVDLLFEFSAALFGAKGVAGDIVAVLGTLVTVVGSAIAGYLAYIAATQGLIAVGSTVVGALTTVATAIAGIISAIAGLISLPVLVVAAIVAIAAALIFNIGGARDFVASAIGDIIAWFGRLLDKAGDNLGKLWELVDGVLGGLASDAVEWGKALFNNFLSGLKGLGEAVAQIFLRGMNAVINTINAGIERIPREIRSSMGISTIGNVSGGGGGGGGGSGGFAARRNTAHELYVDGRQVTRSTSRYSDEATSRRGRYS